MVGMSPERKTRTQSSEAIVPALPKIASEQTALYE